MKLWLLALTAAFAFGLGAGENDRCKFFKEAKLSGETGKLFYVIPLDAEIYRHAASAANGDFADIRITDRDGNTVPFAVIDLYDYIIKTQLAPLPGKIVSFTRDEPANRATITYQLSPPVPRLVSRLALKTGMKNFNKRITVTSGTKMLVADAALFNYDKNVDLEATVFDFAPAEVSTLRLAIDNFMEKTEADSQLEHRSSTDAFTENTVVSNELRIDAITVYETKQNLIRNKLKTTDMFSPAIISCENKDGKTTFLFDLGRIPFTQVVIASTTPRYQRRYRLTLQSPSVQTRSSSTLRPGNNVISLNALGNRYDTAELVIENGDDSPLADMTFKWTAPEKVLLVDGANIKGDSLLVWYGSDDSKMPNYDIRRYAETLNLSDFGVFGLAAGKPNQESISRTEQSGWHINIFTVAIAVASLALTALVIWVALKMKDE